MAHPSKYRSEFKLENSPGYDYDPCHFGGRPVKPCEPAAHAAGEICRPSGASIKNTRFLGLTPQDKYLSHLRRSIAIVTRFAEKRLERSRRLPATQAAERRKMISPGRKPREKGQSLDEPPKGATDQLAIFMRFRRDGDERSGRPMSRRRP